MAMAMQTGLSSSKAIILIGAGLTGSIILRNGRLSDVLSEIQDLVKGVNEAEISEHFDASLLAAQIRRLTEEVRDLTLSRPVAIVNGECNGSLASYIMPAAAIGAMGYCYMWWKGWSFSDVMFVTKHNMANAVANVSKQLEQVSTALVATRRYLSHRLENLDGKLDEQKEASKLIMNEVNEVKTDLSQIGFDIESIQMMVSGLEGKIGLLEDKQDMTNAGIQYLCHFAGGIKNGLNANIVQEASMKLESSHSPSRFSNDKPLKGLQFLAETLEVGETGEVKTNGICTENLHEKPLMNTFTKPSTVHRLYPSCILLKKDGLAL